MNSSREPYRIIFVISSVLVGLDAIGVKPKISNDIFNGILDGLYYILFTIVVIYAVIFFINIINKNKKEQMVSSEKDIPKELIESLKRCGIRDIHFDKVDNYEKLTQKLSESVKKPIDNIWILVYHGQQMLEYIKETLVYAIGKNINIHLLIASEDSYFMNEIWKMEEVIPRINKGNVEKGKHKQLTAFNEINLLRTYIMETYSNLKNSYFEIKQYNT